MEYRVVRGVSSRDFLLHICIPEEFTGDTPMIELDT